MSQQVLAHAEQSLECHRECHPQDQSCHLLLAGLHHLQLLVISLHGTTVIEDTMLVPWLDVLHSGVLHMKHSAGQFKALYMGI